MAPQAVETLLAEPDFSALVQGYKALDAMPEEEQRRILTQLARHLLMEAAALGDIRVACFILREEGRGQDPACTLADGAIAAHKRAARPAPAPPATSISPGPPRAPRDPDSRMIERVEARLRGELQQEDAAVVQAATSDEVPGEEPAAAEAPGDEPEVCASSEPDEAEAAPRRRTARPGPGLFLSDHQRRAIEFLTLLRTVVADPPPDEPPTPRARAP